MEEAEALIIFFKETSDLNDKHIAEATKKTMKIVQRNKPPTIRTRTMHYCNFIIDYIKKNEAGILDAVKVYDALYPLSADKKENSQEQYQKF